MGNNRHATGMMHWVDFVAYEKICKHVAEACTAEAYAAEACN